MSSMVSKHVILNSVENMLESLDSYASVFDVAYHANDEEEALMTEAKNWIRLASLSVPVNFFKAVEIIQRLNDADIKEDNVKKAVLNSIATIYRISTKTNNKDNFLIRKIKKQADKTKLPSWKKINKLIAKVEKFCSYENQMAELYSIKNKEIEKEFGIQTGAFNYKINDTMDVRSVLFIRNGSIYSFIIKSVNEIPVKYLKNDLLKVAEETIKTMIEEKTIKTKRLKTLDKVIKEKNIERF